MWITYFTYLIRSYTLGIFHKFQGFVKKVKFIVKTFESEAELKFFNKDLLY